jgi:predicted nucleic acid-binding protein
MVIADTNIFISVFRGNTVADTLLRKYHSQISISVITLMELNIGATNVSKRETLRALLLPYEVINLNKSTGNTAVRLINTYVSEQRTMTLGDALIAATCLEHRADLLTFNTADFRFIKGLQLAG